MEKSSIMRFHTINSEVQFKFKWCISKLRFLPRPVRSPQFSPSEKFPKHWSTHLLVQNESSFSILLEHCNDGNESHEYRVHHKMIVLNGFGRPLLDCHGSNLYSNNSRLLGKFDMKTGLSFDADDDLINIYFELKFFGLDLKTTEDFAPAEDDLGSIESQLWKSKESADCKFSFCVERTEEAPVIFAHSMLLASRSKTFEKMLQNDNSFMITDAKKEVFESVLEYLYTSKLSRELVDLETMPKELYAAACKYDVQGLRKLCVSHMLSHPAEHKHAELKKLAQENNDQEFLSLLRNIARKNRSRKDFVFVV